MVIFIFWIFYISWSTSSFFHVRSCVFLRLIQDVLNWNFNFRYWLNYLKKLGHNRKHSRFVIILKNAFIGNWKISLCWNFCPSHAVIIVFLTFSECKDAIYHLVHFRMQGCHIAYNDILTFPTVCLTILLYWYGYAVLITFPMVMLIRCLS